jgi:hypothetical protein
MIVFVNIDIDIVCARIMNLYIYAIKHAYKLEIELFKIEVNLFN